MPAYGTRRRLTWTLSSRLSIEVKADAEKVLDWIEKWRRCLKLHVVMVRAHYVTWPGGCEWGWHHVLAGRDGGKDIPVE